MISNDKSLTWTNSWQEETQADTESDDDEQQIYNPLKLPMGWDGKPIPYWLYKLHGLGQVISSFKYSLEVCWLNTSGCLFLFFCFSNYHLFTWLQFWHFRNSSVRYVGTTVTGVVGRLSGISRNGVISMGCVVLAYQTPRTSTRSRQSRYPFWNLPVMWIDIYLS